MVDNYAFCTKIVRFLQARHKRPITELGGLRTSPHFLGHDERYNHERHEVSNVW